MNKNLATAGKFLAFKEMGQKAEACFTFVSKFSLKEQKYYDKVCTNCQRRFHYFQLQT